MDWWFMDKFADLLVDLVGQDPLSCQKSRLFPEDPASNKRFVNL